MKKKTAQSGVIGEVLFLFGVILLWQIIYTIGVDGLSVWKAYSMPSPVGVWKSFMAMISQGILLPAIGNSLLRGAVGYLISLGIGSVLGILMNHFSFLHRNMRPLVMGIQTLPSICWVPFSILWFGLTQKAIIFVVIMGSAFSMAIAVDNAILNVPPIYKKAALTMGANQKQIYRKVIFPASLPELISGMKQGWSFAWRALMSGEVMTTSIGLGQTLMTGRNLADINQVMLVMVVIVIVGILIDQVIFRNIEKIVLRKRGLETV
ncbi:MAG: ABC transporter permease [Lachnospiraceae bacterium]|nr:ABC transporter permease [Lachnospiraceae bacterium]